MTPKIEMEIETRWSKKQKNGIQVSAVAARQAELWEDQERDGKTNDINQFFKPEETAETKGNDLKNDDTWMQVQKTKKDGKTWENIT